MNKRLKYELNLVSKKVKESKKKNKLKLKLFKKHLKFYNNIVKYQSKE
jgi:hypothetical protein